MNTKYILSIDQGTTSSRVAVLNHEGRIVDMFSHAFDQIIKDDKVLQDAELIFSGVKNILDEAILKYGKDNIYSIGITNQRETTVIFDEDGKPLDYAISWQSKHTNDICETWRALGYEPYVKRVTGLPINPYFSASKMAYFLEQKHIKDKMKKEKVRFGTMDTFLLYRLTGGKSYYTDITNASRTMLLNIDEKDYDEKLLKLFNIKRSMLPDVKLNQFDFGYYKDIPIKAMIGDQQSALFGHLAFKKGAMKVTYGTGAFILMNTGSRIYQSKSGLITTIGFSYDNEVTYAVEGSIFVAGASVKWLRDQLEIIKTSSESEVLARKSERRMYFVPAFVGLGAPYWDTKVRGAMFGITADVNKCDIAKATLDAISFQVKEVVDVMIKETEIPLEEVYIDGGVSDNGYLMQYQSDLLRCPLIKPFETEITALGAGFLAGLPGLYPNVEFLRKHKKIKTSYKPKLSYQEASKDFEGWKRAVRSARTY